LIGILLLVAVTVTQTFVTQYLFFARADGDWDHQRLGWMLSAVALAGSFLRAIGLGLIVAAVFVGRRVGQRVGPIRGPRPGEPPPRPSEDQGITNVPGS
jgi:hypothetical protein